MGCRQIQYPLHLCGRPTSAPDGGASDPFRTPPYQTSPIVVGVTKPRHFASLCSREDARSATPSSQRSEGALPRLPAAATTGGLPAIPRPQDGVTCYFIPPHLP
jgi:hypothetical protein